MIGFSLKQKLFMNKDLVKTYESQISELKEYNRILTEKNKRKEKELQELKQILVKYDMHNKEIIILKYTQETFKYLHFEVVQSQKERIQELKMQNKTLVSLKTALEERLQEKEKYLLYLEMKIKKTEAQVGKIVYDISERTNQVLAEREFDLKLINREIENAVQELRSLKQGVERASREASKIISDANEEAQRLTGEKQKKIAILEEEWNKKNKKIVMIERNLKKYDSELEYYQNEISNLLSLSSREEK